MTEETPTPLEGGPSACPFVAFEDDRDHRSSAPDFRHRCFAAAEPEPRAFPHQERYCLAADFPQCPIFLDWARQEAAGVKQPTTTSAAGTAVGLEESGLAAAGATLEGEAAPTFLAGRSRSVPARATSTPRSAEAAASLWSHDSETKRSSAPSAPPAPSSLGVPAVAMARRGPSHPGWENPPRLENFPRLRSREERHTNQLLLYAVIGVSILMVALIMIPILTSQKGATGAPSQSPGASASQNQASANASASRSGQPTPGGSAGYVKHIVKSGESLFKIALDNGLQVWEIQLANPGQLDNPDYIQVGEVIYLPPAGLLTHPPASPSPS